MLAVHWAGSAEARPKSHGRSPREEHRDLPPGEALGPGWHYRALITPAKRQSGAKSPGKQTGFLSHSYVSGFKIVLTQLVSGEVKPKTQGRTPEA